MLRASTTAPPPKPEAEEAVGEGVNGGDAEREFGVEGVEERITGVVGADPWLSREEGYKSGDAGRGKEAEGTYKNLC